MKEILKKLNTYMAEQHLIDQEERVSYEKAKEEINNPNNFAKKINTETYEISPGFSLSCKTIELGDGYFTNMYDITFDNQDPLIKTKILTRQVPIYPHRIFRENPKKETKERPIVAINGAFFFLQDEQLEKNPTEIMYNLNIRDGEVLGLPSVERGALFTNKDGKIVALNIKPKGTIKIGNERLDWIGGEQIAHKHIMENIPDKEAVLFNSACCTIQYENPKDKTSLRKLRKDLNKTPEGASITDIVVKKNKDKKLVVTNINQGGGTDFFEGNFILQIKNAEHNNAIKIGDEVTPETIDGVDLSNIDSAMTVGPMVKDFLKKTDHQINHDPSLGTFPPFDPNTRYARSIICEDEEGKIHMIVFDAVPRSQFMKGVTPKEAAEHIPEKTKWATFLDGGQSSRLTFVNPKNNTITDARGNMQYIRLHEKYKTGQGAVTEDQFLWSKRGRPLTSMVVAYKK